MTSIDAAYQEANPRSAALFAEQRRHVPGGFTHMSRQLAPFPLFVERNQGSRKWDVDGHEYRDYWLGHGALLLGHAHPAVLSALQEQAAKGSHAGGESPLVVEWARLITEMVPSAELVRFTSSGGEATQMALRIARAATGRDRILKFQGCFHGWHDSVAAGVYPPYGVPLSPGIPAAVLEKTVAVPFHDLAAVERELEGRDVAAVILEPGGPYNDTVPSDPAFLRGLRELTSAAGSVLVFDEVVTGFRYALGGVQETFKVTPDLTTLGKVIGGGLAAGAVAGRAELMELLAWRADPVWERGGMIPHPGTWNAAPIVAAAGVAALRTVRETGAVDRARELTDRLVDGFNAVFAELEVKAFAYNRASIFKTAPGEPPALVRGDFSAALEEQDRLAAGWGARGPSFRKALLLEGVDLMRTGGFLSSAHTEMDVDFTCSALERALLRLRAEDAI